MKPETRFKVNRVDPFLKTLKNTHVYPIQQASITGTPDRLLCVMGRFVALELKSEEGKPSPLQKWNLDETKRCGGISIVACPQNWVHVKLRLQRLDQGEEIDD